MAPNPFLVGFTTALLDSLFAQLAGLIVKGTTLLVNGRDELKNLNHTLLRLQRMLNEVEGRLTSNRAWESLTTDINDAIYDADDLLNLIELQVPRDPEHFNISEFQKALSRLSMPIQVHNIRKKLDKVGDKLQKLCEFDGGKQLCMEERPQTSSFRSGFAIYGIDEEKTSLLHWFLSDELEMVRIVSIFGVAGIGKSTLAQTIYNDETVKSHFALRMWVSVGYHFDSTVVTRSALHSAACYGDDTDLTDLGPLLLHLTDLDSLQSTLERFLKHERFLLVLDDVWDVTCWHWDEFIAPLRVGLECNGSKILITSRTKTIMQSIMIDRHVSLPTLSNEISWLLFGEIASMCPDDWPNLVEIGKIIINKCNGLPLALKTFGSLLRSTKDEKEWESISKNNIWDFPSEKSHILSSLWFTFQNLPRHLKQCLAYCSIFPKEYKFRKQDLVQQWIAEGFIHKQSAEGTQLEDVGEGYFSSLLDKHFFNEVGEGDELYGYPRYIMPHLINDLVVYISRNEYCRVEGTNNTSMLNAQPNVRHLSLVCVKIPSELQKQWQASPKLRTLLLLGQVRIENNEFKMFDNVKLVRVLDLSGTQINTLPSFIAQLIHLKYLDLSTTLIPDIGEDVCELESLETLRLRHCGELIGISECTLKFKNLRHLDLEGSTNLMYMAPHIGTLSHIRTLNAFAVGTWVGYQIQELNGMNELQGMLHISRLQHVESEDQAREAALNEKYRLSKLKFQWTVARDDEATQQVLAGLRPHRNIQEVHMDNYGGSRFPTWVSDSTFCNIVALSLTNCQRCTVLPPLGQLPMLKSLYISKMPALINLDKEFCGEGVVKGFPSLENLEFKDMPNFSNWGGIQEGDVPFLRQLSISKCNELKTLPMLQHFLSLESLTFTQCQKIPLLIEESVPPSLRSLTLDKCDSYMADGRNQLQRIATKCSVKIIDNTNP